jgi:protein NEDD1
MEYISCIEDSDLSGGAVTSLGFNNNSMYLAYSSSSGYLKIWDLKTSNTGLNYKLSNNYITTLSFNNESTYLTTGTSLGEVMNFNMLTSTPSTHKFNSFFKLNHLKYSPLVGNLLGTVFDDGCVRVMDMNTGDIVNNFGGYHQGAATSLSFSPINKVFLCSVGVDSRINFFDISSKKHIKTLLTDSSINSVCFFSDGQTIACGNALGNIVLYDLRYFNTPKSVLKGHQSGINYLDFSKRTFNKITGSNLSSLTNTSKVLDNVSMSIKSNRSFGSIDGNIPKETKDFREQNYIKKPDKTFGDSKTNLYENAPKIDANKSLKDPAGVNFHNINNQINNNALNAVNNLKSLNESINSHSQKINLGNVTNNFLNQGVSCNLNSNLNNFNNHSISVENKDTSFKEINIDKKHTNKKDPLTLYKNLSLNNLHNMNNPLNINQNNNLAINSDHNMINNINNNLQNSQRKGNLQIDVEQDNKGPSNFSNNNNLNVQNDKTSNYIKTIIESEMFKMKSFIHEEINSLHVDLIRQFEIQNVKLILFRMKL